LPIENPEIKAKVEEWCASTTNLDYRFVYYLLGAKGICVVPSTSFCTDLKGFRVTLLEEDEDELRHVFTEIHDAIISYLASAK
jgi:aspartate/methionine/tyrosine aminotransferase